MYELVNVFESFLPQLLTYPNPADPLNLEAANLMNSNLTEYHKRVRLLVKEHATAAPQKMQEEELKPLPPAGHKESTDAEEEPAGGMDLEDRADQAGSDFLSHPSDLSSLSDTSDICDEHMA